MKEKKTILHKKEHKALFLYQWGSKTEFVIATLDGKDLNKVVGDVVDGWYSGKYFTDIVKASKYFEENY